MQIRRTMPAGRGRKRIEASEVVLGLQWAPDRKTANGAPANLDAICLLNDSRDQPCEVISPERPRNANGSVMHTGDSRTGAGAWDDERIFVFMDALPHCVHTIVFAVIAPDRRPLCNVDAASCHLTDGRTDDELLRVELTEVGPLTEYCVATLQRTPDGWVMDRGGQLDPGFSEALSLARRQ